MKNIILLIVTLFLSLNLIGCNRGGSGDADADADADAVPKGALNVLNQTDYGLEVQLEGKKVLELKTGECANLTQDQLKKLSLKEITKGYWDWDLDEVFCNNFPTNRSEVSAGTPQCELKAKSVYVENDKGEKVLMEYQAPAKDSEEKEFDFNKCKPVGVEAKDENADEEDAGDDEEEEEEEEE